MTWKRLKTWQLWIGLVVFGVVLCFAISPVTMSDNAFRDRAAKAAILLVVVFLYGLVEVSKDLPLLKEQIQIILSSVDLLSTLDPNQNLRSNMFRYCRLVTKFRIIYSHNMDGDKDSGLEIPQSRGCTGLAWTEKRQVWAERDCFFDDSKIYTLPPTELKMVRPDLEWICSTPVVKDGKRIAVFNVDGNKKMTNQQRRLVELHSIRIAKLLAELIG